MGVAISIIFYWMIWQFCTQHVFSKECRRTALHYQLRPTNLSVKTREPYLLLFWDCDVPEENLNDITYEIYRKSFEETWNYETERNECSQEIPLTQTYKDLPTVCLKVTPAVRNKPCEQFSSEICVDSERKETLAENISCIVYNVSSMICKWTFGKYEQHNTTYSLYVMQEEKSKQYCQQYEYDQERRMGSCTIHDLNLHFFKDVTIIFEGSGPETQIIKDLFKPAEQEIFNPPRNITLLCSGEDITIYWKSPHKHYVAADECFEYMIEKNKEPYITTGNQYTISNLVKECSIRIRAKGKQLCEMNTNWGQWSEMKVCEMHQNNPEHTLDVALISAIVLSGLIIVLLITITVQYKRTLNLCFPRIPQPKNYFDCTEDCEINIQNNDCVDALQPVFETEEFITQLENIS
ncbi:interleukin-5 receptor subunit alpha-like [Mixophyes fleayi]|uniref:interleukin-5 receptor subunit alpha-like n=1 Tax=Mixophyes fleayi TaxID=3061075 RepID=UPI003F4D8834